MIIIRKSEERRLIDKKNQKTWMTFDRENTADVLQNGFGALKILNEEILSLGSGFIPRTRKNMVSITYIRGGLIIHKGLLEKSDFI
jgi:quercetin 2,3-dioxygenase